ncbi:hypothetical protein NPX13_g5304 [Xylaria arbuscula]|uniref:RING-type domain-containing protein n=1 Tax=Xylaria arbuscula TaxID=114810 RepID=A0A9W8NE91_9PEZI|nr:hypothetical protein NPX13_g5304 [Xylaria arbuscula]
MTIIVDTNNFKEVLRHFDDDGELTDKQAVRIAIDCPICLEKRLTITNPDFDEMNPTTHETYRILPCGHAFGADCLHNWINMGGDTCPSCRKPLEFVKRDLRTALTNLSRPPTTQANDIMWIRCFLARQTVVELFKQELEEHSQLGEVMYQGYNRLAQDIERIIAWQIYREHGYQVTFRVRRGSDDQQPTVRATQGYDIPDLGISHEAGTVVTARIAHDIIYRTRTRES